LPLRLSYDRNLCHRRNLWTVLLLAFDGRVFTAEAARRIARVEREGLADASKKQDGVPLQGQRVRGMFV
jgi:hypothetical protein